jgi:hypothetical protein
LRWKLGGQNVELTPDESSLVLSALIPAAIIAPLFAYLLHIVRIRTAISDGFQPWQGSSLYYSFTPGYDLIWHSFPSLIFALPGAALFGAGAAGCAMVATFSRFTAGQRAGQLFLASVSLLFALGAVMIGGGRNLIISIDSQTISGGELRPGDTLPLAQLTNLYETNFKTHHVWAKLNNGTKLELMSVNDSGEATEVVSETQNFIATQGAAPP